MCVCVCVCVCVHVCMCACVCVCVCVCVVEHQENLSYLKGQHRRGGRMRLGKVIDNHYHHS